MSNGLGNAIAALGAGVAGYARGKAIYDDREFEKEERDRRRLEWKDQDRVRADKEALRTDFITGMGDATPQQSPIIPYARTGMSDSAQQATPGQQVMPWQQATPGLAAAQKVDAVMTQPGGQPSGLSQAPKTPTMIAHGQRLLKGYESVMTGAAKRGDIDSFTQAFNKAAEVRGIIRSNLRDQADREHVLLSGGKDFSPYARIFSEMVDDGTTLEAITNQNGSYTLKGTGRDGKPFEHHVKDASEMRGLVNQLFDPSAMRQLEAQRAQKVWESNLDTAKGIAIATGTEAAKAQYREPAKPEEAKVTQLDMGEGRPKQLVITRGGKVISTVGGEDAGEAAPLDKKTANDIRDAVDSLFTSPMDSFNPDVAKNKSQARVYTSQLIQSNQGSEAGRRLDTNTAANIGAGLVNGSLQETQFTDSEGNKWRGVEFEGVKYLLDPTPIKPDNNESAAKAQKAASDAGIKFPVKAPPLKKTAYAGKEAPPKRGKDANVPAGAVWSKEIGAWVEQGVGKTRIYYPEQ